MNSWKRITPQEAAQHPLYGIKNWLAVFAFCVIFGALKSLASLAEELRATSPTMLQFLNIGAPYATMAKLALGLDLATGAVICWALFTKQPKFRWIASGALLTGGPAIVLLMITAQVILPGGAQGKVEAELALALARWLFGCAIWVSYLNCSKRVRVTFEHLIKRDVAINAPQPNDLAPPIAPTMWSAPPINSRTDQAENALWAQALAEFEGSQRDPGLWARLFSETHGDESAAKAAYLRIRVSHAAESGSQPPPSSPPIPSAPTATPLVRSMNSTIQVPDGYIRAAQYLAKHRTTKAAMDQAIGLHKLSAINENGVLWVQDAPIERFWSKPRLFVAIALTIALVASGALPGFFRGLFGIERPAIANDASVPTIATSAPPAKQPTTYQSRVRELMAAAKDGRIPTILAAPNPPPQEIAPWSQEQVNILEANQTWWMEGDVISLHLTNRTSTPLWFVELRYSPGSCSLQQDNSPRYRINLSRPILPVSDAIVAIGRPVEVSGQQGCLTIVDAWG